MLMGKCYVRLADFNVKTERRVDKANTKTFKLIFTSFPLILSRNFLRKFSLTLFRLFSKL